MSTRVRTEDLINGTKGAYGAFFPRPPNITTIFPSPLDVVRGLNEPADVPTA